MQFSWLRHSLSSSILILLFLTIINCNIWSTTVLADDYEDPPAPELPPFKFPALLAFGDSMFDTGNNNFTSTFMKSNFYPYGINLGVATGRFSNSKVGSDIIANSLKLKDSLPPYLKPDLKSEDILTGVSFASGGSGYDPLTPNLVTALSLEDQLKNYNGYRDKVRGLIGEKAITFIREAPHIVAAGSDDIVNYFTLRSRKLEYNLYSYTDFIRDSAIDFVQKLYDIGARRIGVIGVPPIGCVPSQRTATGCQEEMNRAAKIFNSKLNGSLAALGARLPESKIVYMDIYNDYLDFTVHTESWGFEIANKSCCQTGNKDFSYLCNKENPKTCGGDVDNFVFWDGYHFTEKAYNMLFAGFFVRHNFEKFV